MKGFILKIKTLLHIRSSSKRSYAKGGLRPVRDWYVILGASAILFCCLSAVAYYFFILTSEGKVFSSDKKTPVKSVTIDEGLLKNVVDEIARKEGNISSFSKDKNVPPDPSR